MPAPDKGEPSSFVSIMEGCNKYCIFKLDILSPTLYNLKPPVSSFLYLPICQSSLYLLLIDFIIWSSPIPCFFNIGNKVFKHFKIKRLQLLV